MTRFKNTFCFILKIVNDTNGTFNVRYNCYASIMY